VEVKNLAVQKQESLLNLSMDIDLSNLELNRQHFNGTDTGVTVA